MKEAFITKKFGPDSLRLLAQIDAVIKNYVAQGFDLTLRQLYYQLVAGNLLPDAWIDEATGSANNEKSYKNVGSLVSDARLAGLIDWDIIKDRGREVVTPNHWENPAAILRASAQQFRIDRWDNQPNHIEVMVEKQALEGILEPLCDRLDISFTANKGYSSSSAMYEAGKRMLDKISIGKSVHVIYLGDHDPSGMDMTRDVEERLQMFARVAPSDDLTIEVHRVALNMPQIKKLRPPENPAKVTDSRAIKYIREFGKKSWELDAIEPRALAKIVTDQVEDLRDEDQWEKSLAREKKMRDELTSFANKSKFNDD